MRDVKSVVRVAVMEVATTASATIVVSRASVSTRTNRRASNPHNPLRYSQLPSRTTVASAMQSVSTMASVATIVVVATTATTTARAATESVTRVAMASAALNITSINRSSDDVA